MLGSWMSRGSVLHSLQLSHRSVQRQQVAWNWQHVLRRRLDRQSGQVKYEEWDVVARGFQEPTLLDGTTLLSRHLRQERHIKPTEAKRRLNASKIYKRSVKRVDDLLGYIKFIQSKEK